MNHKITIAFSIALAAGINAINTPPGDDPYSGNQVAIPPGMVLTGSQTKSSGNLPHDTGSNMHSSKNEASTVLIPPGVRISPSQKNGPMPSGSQPSQANQESSSPHGILKGPVPPGKPFHGAVTIIQDQGDNSQHAGNSESEVDNQNSQQNEMDSLQTSDNDTINDSQKNDLDAANTSDQPGSLNQSQKDYVPDMNVFDPHAGAYGLIGTPGLDVPCPDSALPAPLPVVPVYPAVDGSLPVAPAYGGPPIVPPTYGPGVDVAPVIAPTVPYGPVQDLLPSPAYPAAPAPAYPVEPAPAYPPVPAPAYPVAPAVPYGPVQDLFPSPAYPVEPAPAYPAVPAPAYPAAPPAAQIESLPYGGPAPSYGGPPIIPPVDDCEEVAPIAPLPGPYVPPTGPPPYSGGIYDDCEEDIVAPITPPYGPGLPVSPPYAGDVYDDCEEIVGFDTYEAGMASLPTPAPTYSAELDTYTTETPTYSAALDSYDTDLPNTESDTLPDDYESKNESQIALSSSTRIVSQTVLLLLGVSLILA